MPNSRRPCLLATGSWLLACALDEEIADWSPARRELEFASGAVAMLFSGANPQALRGGGISKGRRKDR